MTQRLLLFSAFLVVGATALPAPGDTNASAVAAPDAAAGASTTPAASPSPASPAPPVTPGGGTGPQLSTYTVGSGDTLWSISHKFSCSIASIKKLNHLKKNRLKPGQILQLPPSKAPRSAADQDAAPTNKEENGRPEKPILVETQAASEPQVADAVKPLGHTKSVAKSSRKTKHGKALVAQPVQDFDIPPSTFASCPQPPSSTGDNPAETIQATNPITATTTTPGQVALPDLVPAPIGQRTARLTPSAPAQHATAVARASTSTTTSNPPLAVFGQNSSAPASPSQSSKTFASAISDFFGNHGSSASEAGEWGNRFLTEARSLAGHGIGYDQSWRPDGETHSWSMDCSNTTRYLYQVTAGIQLPRTASDQYYYLHLQDKAWDVPMTSRGFADCGFLQNNLKPGDLLFWENTYRPERQPPITHVMIFLGRNERGQWIMAGSQTSHGGLYNRHRSGPDVYVFDPTRATGGYSTWLGLVRHTGRFCAYGRPLEADVRKLSVAAND